MDSIWIDFDFPIGVQTGDARYFDIKNEDHPPLEVGLLLRAVQSARAACSREECGKPEYGGYEPPVFSGDFDSF